jgi:CheY-like chemotaxis protein
MNTLLKQPEPVTNPTAWEAKSPLPNGVPVQRLTAVERRARILYVDDEPQLRRLGELVLVQSGYEVHTAADGAEAWDALQHVHYNLLITDHDMPRLTGLELATQARLAGMRIPIVLASGSANALCDPASSWLDLAARLPKPFGADALVMTVEQVLRVANRKGECLGAMISTLTHIARIQPFPHGGINE